MKIQKRVFLNEKFGLNELLTVSLKNKLHHLNTVMRIKSGENIRVFNPTEGEWLAQIKEISNKKAIIEIKSKLRDAEPTPNVAVAFALIKHHRLGILVEKCTEIGASAFIPLITERTTAPNIKLDKLNAYILSAVEQCERISMPTVHEPISLQVFLQSNASSTILACSCTTESVHITQALVDQTKPIIILIGPEGGFSQRELCSMIDCKNVISVSLGNNILRAETAAIFALSCVMASLAG